MTQKLVTTLFSLGLFGYWLYIVGLNGWLNQWTIGVPSILVAFLLIRLLRSIYASFIQSKNIEKFLIIALFCQFALYSLGLFVPETGFDALWYHLPLAQVYATTGTIAKIPEIIYSTMPRLGDLYFIPAFIFGFPPKFISFIFAILFATTTFAISRLYLSRIHSLLAVLIVNSAYIIAWLSSSAYIDLTRATFELASLYCLFRLIQKKVSLNTKSLILSAVFTGFALSTKFHSFLHLIALTFVLVLHNSSKKILTIKHYGLFIILPLTVAFPWYLENYLQSGHPLYPLNDSAKQLDQLSHAGASSSLDWFSNRLLRLPLLFWDVTFKPTDYLTPIFLILLPFIFFQLRSLIKNLFTLLLYLLCYLILWWFLPPPETRYLLTALPLLAILSLQALFSLPPVFNKIKLTALFFIIISLCINFGFRLYSSRKYIPVITGHITPQQYIDSQTTFFNRDVLAKFHSDYWQQYRYPPAPGD